MIQAKLMVKREWHVESGALMYEIKRSYLLNVYKWKGKKSTVASD